MRRNIGPAGPAAAGPAGPAATALGKVSHADKMGTQTLREQGFWAI